MLDVAREYADEHEINGQLVLSYASTIISGKNSFIRFKDLNLTP